MSEDKLSAVSETELREWIRNCLSHAMRNPEAQWKAICSAVDHIAELCDARVERRARAIVRQEMSAGCRAPYETSGDVRASAAAPSGSESTQAGCVPESAGKPVEAGASPERRPDTLDCHIAELAATHYWDAAEMRAVRELVTCEVARAMEECAKLLDAFAVEADGVADAHAAIWAEECARRVRAIAAKGPKP